MIEDIAADVVTETTHVGLGQKLIGSVFGVLVGVLLLIASCVGLFWNEGRAVTTARSLTEGAGQVLDVTPSRIAAENEGKLVHVTGPLQTTAPLVDPELGVSALGAVLVRHVEMYQWKEEKSTETRKNFGGSEERVTTYSYHRTWSSTRIDSGHFKSSAGHSNPRMRYQGRTIAAKDATLGAFRPSENVLRKLVAGETVAVDKALESQLRSRTVGANTQVVDGLIYMGADPANPTIGDLRISYRAARPDTISIVGRQVGSDFAPYRTKAGNSLLFVKTGAVSATDIFAQAQVENRILTWVLRGVGVVLMIVGFALLASPLVALGDIVPFIGSLIGASAVFAAFILAAVVAPIVIAMAWLWYRPLVAIAVVAAGLGIAYAMRMIAPRKPAVPQSRAAPAAAR
jgi:hypothetical protein